MAYAVNAKTIRQVGEFLWDSRRPVAVVRDRSALPSGSRKLDLVAPEEIAQAIEQTVADAFGMESAAIPSAACRLLGFPRVTDEMKSRFEPLIASMLEEGRLVPQGPHLVVRAVKNESA